jgi:RNA polymerase sigma-70 factor (ECF subfamily)
VTTETARRFEQLMREHERMVLRVALRMTGSMELAQDAAQETFLRLWRHRETVDPGAGVKTWLYRTVTNVTIDQMRRHRPQEELDFDPPAAARHAEQLESAELVAKALARTTESERAAIVLREIEGLETAEVAEILGVSEITVRSHISNGKAKMRAWLERSSNALDRR